MEKLIATDELRFLRATNHGDANQGALLKIVFVSFVDAQGVRPHKKFNGVKTSLAFPVVLMLLGHTFESSRTHRRKNIRLKKNGDR
jgi:hypothetical protein